MNEIPKSGSFLRQECKFDVGDRVVTSNQCIGTVVRVGRDKMGDFIVVRLDILPREFAYDPCDLKKVQ